LDIIKKHFKKRVCFEGTSSRGLRIHIDMKAMTSSSAAVVDTVT